MSNLFQRAFGFWFSLFLGGFLILDLLADLKTSPPTHWVIEIFLILGVFFFAIKLARTIVETRKELLKTQNSLAEAARDLDTFRQEASRYVIGFSQVIDSQFQKWGLTPSEKEVALLLIKGLSHKEIAQVRSTTENSARQQSNSVYNKSGISGRAGLAAFFLEDLLTPPTFLKK